MRVEKIRNFRVPLFLPVALVQEFMAAVGIERKGYVPHARPVLIVDVQFLHSPPHVADGVRSSRRKEQRKSRGERRRIAFGVQLFQPAEKIRVKAVRTGKRTERIGMITGVVLRIVVVLMWVIWNKTTFGKNMFAVGSNEEAANVSGVNVSKTIIMVFVLAGMMYAITGFLDGARIASANANTGLNYECDAIAACVIGGVSFVGGIGRISGIVVGVLLLQIIFTGLNFLAVDANMLYIIKGLIILIACAIDMRKYLVKK